MSTDLETMWAKSLATGELAFPRCSACGAWNWYPLAQCSRCQCRETPWTSVASRGRVYSWTLSHHDFVKGSALAEPVAIALIEIAEAPEIRIPCRQARAGACPVIGEPVRLEVVWLEGHPVWCFVPDPEFVDYPAQVDGAP